MFIIPRRSVRTSQPQQAVEIDRQHKLANCLVDVIDLRGTPKSLLLGTPLSTFGSSLAYSRPTKNGIGFDNTASFGGVYFQRNDGAYATAEQTHIAVGQYDLSSGYYAGFFCTADGSGSSASLSLQSTAGVNALVYPGGDTYVGVESSLIGAGQLVLALASKSGSTEVYKNGALIGSGPNSPSVQSTSRLVILGERAASSGYSIKGKQLLHLFFNKKLSAAQIAALSENPWQIFEGEEDYLFIPSIAGGGGPANITGTISATLDSIDTNFTLSAGHSGNLSASLQDISCTISATLGHTGTSAITLEDISASFNGTITSAGAINGTISFTLDDIVSSTVGVIGHSGVVSAPLADVMVSIAGTVAGTPESITGTLAITLDGIGFIASGNSGTITLTQDDINAIKNAIMSDPKLLTVPKFIALK